MKIIVYIRDGKTRFLLAKRAELRALMGEEPAHEGMDIAAYRSYWHDGEWTPWQEVKLRYMSKNSVSFVERATVDTAGVVG